GYSDIQAAEHEMLVLMVENRMDGLLDDWIIGYEFRRIWIMDWNIIKLKKPSCNFSVSNHSSYVIIHQFVHPTIQGALV
ncbi:MAG: hypothetical protein WAX69_12880, partial [Victivallales bacterium]